MSSDEFQALIQEAQADPDLACDQPRMRRELLRLILTALSGVLAVFGKTEARWERAVADVIAARHPLPEADRVALKAELIEAAETGAFNGMRKEARRMIRTFDRKLAAIFGISVGGAFVVGALAGWGLVVVAHWGPYSPSAESALAWHDLITNNPDPRPAIAGAEIRTNHTGRRYYSGLSLWLDPARPPGKE